MNRTAFRKTSLDREPEMKSRNQYVAPTPSWSDRVNVQSPIAARQGLEDFDAVSTRPANDHIETPYSEGPMSPPFLGSRYFWMALTATVFFCGLFAVLMGFGTGNAIAALFRSPGQYMPFLVSMIVIAALQWLFALAAHRQSVTNEMWRRMMMLANQQFADPGEKADEANWRLKSSFERLFTELDIRTAALEETATALTIQISSVMQQSSSLADVNIAQMRNIVEATEVQRDALQRSGVLITTEILPVVSKLETTVEALDSLSKNAGGILGTAGANLQRTTRDLQNCLDELGRTHQSISPEVEKRVARFEAALKRLPDQIEAGLTRMTPLSETIADAAMLSTANIGVIEELGKDITASLQRSRNFFSEFSSSSKALLQEAVDAHLQEFRDQLGVVIREETARITVMSREISHLADTATSVVEKLQEPVNLVSGMTAKALSEMQQSVTGLDENIQEHMRLSISQLNDAASQVVRNASREIESATIALQTRLAATSNDIVQRVNLDTTRFENLISEVGDKSSIRIAAALRDVPTSVAQRMEQEIAKVDGSLHTSVASLAEQMRTVVDTMPGRLEALSRDIVKSLEANLERSFESVVERAGLLNEKFRKNAAETSDSVMSSYVDFIYLAVDRFRSEMEDLNSKFSRTLELTRKPQAAQPEKVEAATE